MSSESYLRPRSLDEALHMLVGGESQVLGGGTYLIGRQARRAARLIDLDRLGFDYVAEDEVGVRCGAMTRLQTLVTNNLLREQFLGMISEAARTTRPSWMLRNMSTVGGEIVQRSRHSALVVALLALDAEVTLATTRGLRRLALHEFYRASGIDVAPFILTEVAIPEPKSVARGAFRRLAQLPSQEPIAAAAVSVSFDGHEIREVRAALGSSIRAPQRLLHFERALISAGTGVDTESLRETCRAGLTDVEFTGEHCLSADYLREMSGLLLTRVCLELLRDGKAETDGDPN